MRGPALAVMARAPVPGQVKTRLQPHLSPEQCSELYTALLRDAIELACSVRAYAPFLAFTPAEAERYFRRLAPMRMGLISQTGSDLGQRMQGVMERLDEEGYSPVVIVGSDLPALQPATLEQAVQSLRNADVCLGPSRDGGYYLVGGRRTCAPIFKGIPWGTARVLEVTIEKSKAAGLTVALLGECADVDTLEDLDRLRLDIRRLRRIPGARVPVHTEAWLEGWE